MTVGVAVGPTSDVEVVKTSFLRKRTLEVSKPLMIIKAWICLRVLRLGTVGMVPIVFLIMMPDLVSHHSYYLLHFSNIDNTKVTIKTHELIVATGFGDNRYKLEGVMFDQI